MNGIDWRVGPVHIYNPSLCDNPRIECELQGIVMKPCEAAIKPREYILNRLNSFNGLPSITNVIFNDPATIVFWADGTKTVVKCQEGDIYSPETGLAMAISKKALGNQGNYCEVFKKWLPEEPEQESTGLYEAFMKAAEQLNPAVGIFKENEK